jgi:hypothetical protein
VRHRTCLFILCLFSLPVIYPLTGGGYILTHDQYFPIHRLVALNRCLFEGQIPPRWTDIFALGYGYPFFNFYAPLAYYLAEIVLLLTNNCVLSIHTIFAFGLIFGGFGVFYWIKDILDEKSGLVAGSIYIYFPYHLVNAYVRGDISELLASSFFPWVFWAFYRLTNEKKNNILWLLIGAFFYACVMLSHNIMALLFSGFLGMYILFLFIIRRKTDSLIRCALALLLGLGLSMYFWFPAFAEKKYIQIGSLLSAAPYQQNFVSPYQLISLAWGYGGSNSMSVQLGIIPLILTITSILVWFGQSKADLNKQGHAVFSWITLTIFVFLMLPMSLMVWKVLPLVHYTLFPWRFLSLIGISSAFLSGYSMYGIDKFIKSSFIVNLITITICLLAIIVTIPYLHKHQILFPKELTQRREIWQTELVSKTFGTTMSNEYLPVGVKDMPQYPARFFIQTEDGTPIEYSPIQYNSIDQVYDIELVKGERIIFSLFYFPGWVVAIDNRPVAIQVTRNGLISSATSSGKHRVELRFTNTPVRSLANAGSVLSILLFGVLSVIYLSRKKIKD